MALLAFAEIFVIGGLESGERIGEPRTTEVKVELEIQEVRLLFFRERKNLFCSSFFLEGVEHCLPFGDTVSPGFLELVFFLPFPLLTLFSMSKSAKLHLFRIA